MEKSLTSSGSEEMNNLISKLPKKLWIGDGYLYQMHGYWYPQFLLEGILNAQSHFKARDDDIILTSSFKTGTTWLKSIVWTIVNGPQDDASDSLTKRNPHAIVETLEFDTYTQGKTPDLSSIPSPRIFHSHAPYNSLPDSIKESNCKVVYIARNPKDVFVSLLHFGANSGSTPDGPHPIKESFDYFCDGFYMLGPYFDHVLEYWNESLNSPQKILFLKYEDMKSNPNEQVKKLASFLGRPLVTDEQVGDVVRRCSFERLKSLEINSTGAREDGMPHSAYFRKGDVGDWKNVLTAEMEERIDQIVQSKYQGTGLNL